MSSAARKRKRFQKRKLIDELKGEISQLKRELEEKEEKNPSSLVRENRDHFRNAVKKELSKYEWSGKNVNVRAGNFSGSDMRDMDLEDMVATDAIFMETDLKGASLKGADLTGADFRDAKFDRFSSLRGAKVKGAIFDLTSLPLLLKLGLKGNSSFKVSFKDKGSYTVLNIKTFMEVLEKKFEGILYHTTQLVSDEEKERKIAELGHEVEGREFDPSLDFDFDFKRRADPIIKEFKRLMGFLNSPPELLPQPSISKIRREIGYAMGGGLAREKVRLESQSKGWRGYLKSVKKKVWRQ